MNPYQWLPSLYTPELRQHYSDHYLQKSTLAPALSPHVYEISALAFRDLSMAEMVNQTILVSGESGAGKTETVKICLSHLSSISATQNKTVAQRVMDSNPILEAFGNAQTRRNDNSSRFGKYLQLEFAGSSSPGLVGSTNAVYLLEKNRVVEHDAQERSFHIFYQLLASSDAVKGKFWSGLKGRDASSFAYLSNSNAKAGDQDGKDFTTTLKALKVIGMEDATISQLIQTVCIVLQLGNIQFSGCDDKSDIATPKEMKSLSALVGLSEADLRQALVERTVTTRSETYKVPLNPEAAKESCDALAKALYHKLFRWLVEQINAATSAKTKADELRKIGLLDIFGFESFQTNGFEQLCINYANEKLQQKFTKDVFREVEAEYEFEGIDLAKVGFQDNNTVVDLIEAKLGLMAMLNEECVRPRGSDREFVYKTISENKASSAIVLDKKHTALEFGVRHYCADVVYDATGFVKKNNDLLATDLELCVNQSKNPIVAYNESNGSDDKRKRSNVVAATVWTKYREGLSTLLAEIEQTRTRYIKCIKPNDEKKPAAATNQLVLDQLRSSGVVGAIEMTRASFPNRLEHRDVLDRFFCLLPSSQPRGPVRTQKKLLEHVNTILTSSNFASENEIGDMFAIGRTRTYFRSGFLEHLEAQRTEAMSRSVVRLQCIARRFLVRLSNSGTSTKKQDDAAAKIQTFFRRKQAFINAERAKKDRQAEPLRRMKAARVKRRKNKAASIIQALVRGVQQRPRFRAALAEAQELENIADQIKALKEKLAQSEEEKNDAVQEAEDRVTKAVAAMQGEEMDTAELQNITSKAKLEESEKVIDFLKRERKRLMGLAKTHKERCERTVQQQGEMDAATEGIVNRMAEVQKYMDVLKANEIVLAKNKESYVGQIKAYRTEVQKVQDHVKNEEDVTAAYRDAVGKIVSLVQEECTDDELVEDIYLLAMENCELALEKGGLGDELLADEDLDLDDLEDYAD